MADSRNVEKWKTKSVREILDKLLEQHGDLE